MSNFIERGPRYVGEMDIHDRLQAFNTENTERTTKSKLIDDANGISNMPLMSLSVKAV